MIRPVVVALIAWSGSTSAQSPAVSTIYCATKGILGQCGTVEIESGYSRLLKLDRQFSTVMLGGDDVVSINMMENHRMVLITGKQKEGRTTLTFLDDTGEPISSAEIIVRHLGYAGRASPVL